MSKDIEQISAVLRAYQDALNNANVEDAVKLYTQDGIVMPQHSPSFVGIASVRKAYEGFFEIIKFDVKFDIQEIVPVSPEYAFARKERVGPLRLNIPADKDAGTNSAGTTVVKGRGKGNEANQELFVFRKANSEWRIARYCFSTTNPPPQ